MYLIEPDRGSLHPFHSNNRRGQIATLGPASCTKDQIEALFLAGVDVFRLNFSHGAHEEKAKVRVCVCVCLFLCVFI